jgi:hypothetical protein
MPGQWNTTTKGDRRRTPGCRQCRPGRYSAPLLAIDLSGETELFA